MRLKRVEESQEVKNIKTQKMGGIIKKTLEDQLASIEKIKNKDRRERESKALAEKINTLILEQKDNLKISEDNLEVLESNIQIETKNIETSRKNKDYLTELYKRVNDI